MKKLISLLVSTVLVSCTAPEMNTAKSIQSSENLMSSDWTITVKGNSTETYNSSDMTLKSKSDYKLWSNPLTFKYYADKNIVTWQSKGVEETDMTSIGGKLNGHKVVFDTIQNYSGGKSIHNINTFDFSQVKKGVVTNTIYDSGAPDIIDVLIMY